MKLQDKLKLLKDKGWTYCKETGDCFSHTGKKVTTITSNHGKKKGYLTCAIRHEGKTIQCKLHQFAWYYVYNEVPSVVDHIDRDVFNNKIENLRNITNQQNTWNNNAKGVNWHKGIKKFVARIGYNNKRINLGNFDNEQDALKAYLEAKKIYHKIGNKD